MTIIEREEEEQKNVETIIKQEKVEEETAKTMTIKPEEELETVQVVPLPVDRVLFEVDCGQETNEAILTFKAVRCLTPVGRFDVEVFADRVQLRDGTADTQIPLCIVQQLFQLPYKDDQQLFVISLKQPIWRAQKSYHLLIAVFGQREQIDVEVEFSDEEYKARFGHLDKKVSGPRVEVLAKLMAAVVGGEIATIDSCTGDGPVVAVDVRRQSGFLYPVAVGLIFVNKHDPIHIRFEDVKLIDFAPSGSSNRFFDLEIEIKSGFVFAFNLIVKEDYYSLSNFISDKLCEDTCGGRVVSMEETGEFGLNWTVSQVLTPAKRVAKKRSGKSSRRAKSRSNKKRQKRN